MDPTRLNLNGYRGGSSRIIHIQWRVVRLIANLNCKVNLIALNPGPGIPFETPAPERVAAFQQIVRQSVP